MRWSRRDAYSRQGFEAMMFRSALLADKLADRSLASSAPSLTVQDALAELVELIDRAEVLAKPYDVAAIRIDELHSAARQRLADAEASRDQGVDLMLTGADAMPSPREQADREAAVRVAVAELSATEQTVAGMTKRLLPVYDEAAAVMVALSAARRRYVAQAGVNMVLEAKALRHRADLLESAAAGILDYQVRSNDGPGVCAVQRAASFDGVSAEAYGRARIAEKIRWFGLAGRIGMDRNSLNIPEVGQ